MNQGTQDVGVAITAAGTTQATATELVNGLNWVTGGAANSGVVLFAGLSGMSQLVYNASGNTIKVYPPTGATINALGTNNPMLLSTGSVVRFWYLSSVQLAGMLSA